ncbi:MAG: exopolyphosphatase, partial [Brachymonas sp.]|nr:exopolyphosphatase [Brachymonas sp.]
MRNGTLLAALDLGSNSFRLEVGKYESGQIERVQYLKETVRLGGGINEQDVLSLDAMERGWACLERFAERISGLRKDHVRAVGTQTLRQAVNREVFLARANQILGVPIEVVAGREEARLIYQGAASLLPRSEQRRLVVDIGGRSTEIIVGKNLDIHALNSFQLGSVTWSMKYFPQGKFTPAAFAKAEVAAKAVLDEALEIGHPDQWDVAYGCSGTVAAISDALALAGGPPGVVTRQGLDWMAEQLLKARTASNLNVPGIRDDRKPIIGG